MVRRPAHYAALSGPPPFCRSSYPTPLRLAVRLPPALGTFPRATGPFRRPPAFVLPLPDVPMLRASRSLIPRCSPSANSRLTPAASPSRSTHPGISGTPPTASALPLPIVSGQTAVPSAFLPHEPSVAPSRSLATCLLPPPAPPYSSSRS